MPWESREIETKIQDILNSLELPPVTLDVRQIFQRLLYRKDKFGGGGDGQIILTCRCISESTGNESAMNDPIIVSAVASCLEPRFIDRGLALIEAFDAIPLVAILRTMRSLDLFSEQSIGHYFSIAIRNKLFNILGPDVLPKPAKPAKAKPKPPARRAADQRAKRMAA